MPRDLLPISRESGTPGSVSRERTASQESLRHYDQLGYYQPSYKKLNYISWSTDVSGVVDFWQAVSNMGREWQQKAKNATEGLALSETYLGINNELTKRTTEWKKNNESGEGYTEFVSRTYSDLAQQALAGIFDPELSGKMRMMLVRGKAGWENSAFYDEQEMRSAYTLGKAQDAIHDITIGAVNNPRNYDSGLEAIENALSAYRAVAGDSAYTKARKAAIAEYTHSYAYGLIQNDPYNFESLAKSGKFNALASGDMIHLKSLAESEIKHREAMSAAAQRAVEAMAVTNDGVMTRRFYDALISSPAGTVTDEDIEASGVSECHKAELKELKQHVTKAAIKQQQIEDAMNYAVTHGQGLGSFSAAQQMNFLRTHLPQAEGKLPTLHDVITMADQYGITHENIDVTQLLMSNVKYSNNADVLLRNVNDYQYARRLNSKLIGEVDSDTELLIDEVAYGSGGNPQVALQIRNDAYERIKAWRNTPTERDRLRQVAHDYVNPPKDQNNSPYEKSFERSWGRVGRNSGLTEEHWYGDRELTNEYSETILEESKSLFSGFYKKRMEEKMSLGEPAETASAAVEQEFLHWFAPTQLVPERVMWRPPEKEFPGLTDKELRNRFLQFASKLNGAILPSGYKLKYLSNKNTDPRRRGALFEYDNGADKGGGYLDLEWSDEYQGYLTYIRRKNGARIGIMNKNLQFVILYFDGRKVAPSRGGLNGGSLNGGSLNGGLIANG